MAREPSAADALYPHLRAQLPERPAQQQTNNSLAASMYPALVKKTPGPPNEDRERLLRHLREANARVDARLQKEGRR